MEGSLRDREHIDKWHATAERFLNRPIGELDSVQDGRRGLRLKASTVEELVRQARTCEIRMFEEEFKLVTLEGELLERGQPFQRRSLAPPPPPVEKKKPRERKARAAPKPRPPKPSRPRGICNCGCGEKITAPLRASQWYAAGHFRRVRPLKTKSDELNIISTQKEG